MCRPAVTIVLLVWTVAGCDAETAPSDAHTEQAPRLSCGDGTVEADGACVPASTTSVGACGIGTSAVGSKCVADLGYVCGTGTLPSGSRCVGSVSCGAGTTVVEGECVPSEAMPAITCGTDTILVGSRCIGTLSCGAGTTRTGGTCVLDTAVVCGAGTMASAGQCVVPFPAVELSTFLGDASATRSAAARSFWASPCLRRELETNDCIEYTPYWHHGLLVSDLDSSEAAAWTASDIAPVGNGRALHIIFSSSSATPLAESGPVFNSVRAPGGGCDATYPSHQDYWQSTSSYELHPFVGVYMAYGRWLGGEFVPLACAVDGSVRFERTGTDQLGLTFNVELSDGTLLTDQRVTFIGWLP
jgi:hypothetical protein